MREHDGFVLLEHEELSEPKIKSINWTFAFQSYPSLIIALIGSVLVGYLLDIVQHWAVFNEISELIIMTPVLLNLKGNLETTLAARISTQANLGNLDQSSKWNILIGNFAIIQIQAIFYGLLAGIFSWCFGGLVHKELNTFNESLLMMSSSMMSASMGSFLISSLMILLICSSRVFNIDPDNIATPLAASMGDLVTLFFLSYLSKIMFSHSDIPLAAIAFIACLLSLPMWFKVLSDMPLLHAIIWENWSPILLSVFISSLSGLILERYIDQFIGIAVLLPVMNGIGGNLAGIYASRYSTSKYLQKENQVISSYKTLQLLNIMVQLPFLLILKVAKLGHSNISILFTLVYLFASIIQSTCLIFISHFLVNYFWARGKDPDNYTLPLIASLGDVIGTICLVVSFEVLEIFGQSQRF